MLICALGKIGAKCVVGLRVGRDGAVYCDSERAGEQTIVQVAYPEQPDFYSFTPIVLCMRTTVTFQSLFLKKEEGGLSWHLSVKIGSTLLQT